MNSRFHPIIEDISGFKICPNTWPSHFPVHIFLFVSIQFSLFFNTFFYFSSTSLSLHFYLFLTPSHFLCIMNPYPSVLVDGLPMDIPRMQKCDHERTTNFVCPEFTEVSYKNIFHNIPYDAHYDVINIFFVSIWLNLW